MNVLLPLIEGFEDIEATTVIDVLRRAGIGVVTAGMFGSMVTSARGVKQFVDKKLDEVKPEQFDAIVLVGGNPGYKTLLRSRKLMDAIVDLESRRKVIAAICAAPAVLAHTGILNDRKATIYPGLEREIPRPRTDRMVVDKNVITAQGPGSAMEFALKIVELLGGKEASLRMRKELIV